VRIVPAAEAASDERLGGYRRINEVESYEDSGMTTEDKAMSDEIWIDWKPENAVPVGDVHCCTKYEPDGVRCPDGKLALGSSDDMWTWHCKVEPILRYRYPTEIGGPSAPKKAGQVWLRRDGKKVTLVDAGLVIVGAKGYAGCYFCDGSDNGSLGTGRLQHPEDLVALVCDVDEQRIPKDWSEYVEGGPAPEGWTRCTTENEPMLGDMRRLLTRWKHGSYLEECPLRATVLSESWGTSCTHFKLAEPQTVEESQAVPAKVSAPVEEPATAVQPAVQRRRLHGELTIIEAARRGVCAYEPKMRKHWSKE
jgi:hypothetical protein